MTFRVHPVVRREAWPVLAALAFGIGMTVGVLWGG